jgi:hypothetical protein
MSDGLCLGGGPLPLLLLGMAKKAVGVAKKKRTLPASFKANMARVKAGEAPVGGKAGRK